MTTIDPNSVTTWPAWANRALGWISNLNDLQEGMAHLAKLEAEVAELRRTNASLESETRELIPDRDRLTARVAELEAQVRDGVTLRAKLSHVQYELARVRAANVRLQPFEWECANIREQLAAETARGEEAERQREAMRGALIDAQRILGAMSIPVTMYHDCMAAVSEALEPDPRKSDPQPTHPDPHEAPDAPAGCRVAWREKGYKMPPLARYWDDEYHAWGPARNIVDELLIDAWVATPTATDHVAEAQPPAQSMPERHCKCCHPISHHTEDGCWHQFCPCGNTRAALEVTEPMPTPEQPPAEAVAALAKLPGKWGEPTKKTDYTLKVGEAYWSSSSQQWSTQKPSPFGDTRVVRCWVASPIPAAPSRPPEPKSLEGYAPVMDAEGNWEHREPRPNDWFMDKDDGSPLHIHPNGQGWGSPRYIIAPIPAAPKAEVVPLICTLDSAMWIPNVVHHPKWLGLGRGGVATVKIETNDLSAPAPRSWGNPSMDVVTLAAQAGKAVGNGK